MPRRIRLTALLALAAGLGGCGSSAPTAAAPSPAADALARSGAGHRFYEIYEPQGRPRGTMIVIHSGGWRDLPGDARRIEAQVAVQFQAQGWRVLNISHTPGPPANGGPLDPRPMFRDVVAFYDQARKAFGGRVCAYGESSGAHLAALLATARPDLTCAVLAAAPLDLKVLLDTTNGPGRDNILPTFGNDEASLDAWSPTRRWSDRIRTRVFAAAATNDEVVPPSQLDGFRAVDPRADTGLIEGSGDGPMWMHSKVDAQGLARRQAQMTAWLDRVVPRRTGAAPRGTDSGSACHVLPRDRWRLLRAGDAWVPQSTPNQPVAATRGCSGSSASQEDGLSLWAFPGAGAKVPAGTGAALELSPGRRISRLSATFRGFLTRPEDWTVGLYAASTRAGAITRPVAQCAAGACQGLRLVKADAGALIAPVGGAAAPDAVDDPGGQRFRLPAGTRRLAWRLLCVNPDGCALDPVPTKDGGPGRPRDPLGQPAILSIYRAAIR